MTIEQLAGDALRVAVLLFFTLVAVAALRRSTAATRRMVLATGLAAALVLPALTAIAPRVPWAPAAAVPAIVRPIIVSEPLSEGPRAGAAPGASRASTPVARVSRVTLARGVMGAWMLGAVVVLARLAVGLVRVRRMVRRSMHAPSWSRAVERAQRVTRTRAVVRMTDAIDAPAVTGVLAPVVLVPRASDAWSEARMHAVLLHEMAHVRQRDCLVQIVGQLVLAAHWFNPLAWLAVRRLRLERELAADDAVIAAGTRPSAYAAELVSIAAAAQAAPAAMGALGMTERSELARRVDAIVDADRARAPLSKNRGRGLAMGAASAALGIACTAHDGKPAAPANASASVAPAASVESASTIDPRLQTIADEELERTMNEWKGEAGAALVLDAKTGEILANAGRAHGAKANVALASAYVTGSTFKAITLSAALEEGVLAPEEKIDCEGGSWTYQGKTMHDASPNHTLSVTDMLAVSSNIGFAKVFDRLGGTRLSKWAHAFHFGEAPPIAGATAGATPARIEEKSFEGAVAAIGEGIQASPLQMASAYAAIANDGVYVAPTLTHRAGASGERILRAETARTVMTMLDGAVNGERATGKAARVEGARIAGKTGTAAWEKPGGEGIYASFIGVLPTPSSKLVILVGVEQPKDGTGGTVAAPAFARIASRAMAAR